MRSALTSANWRGCEGGGDDRAFGKPRRGSGAEEFFAATETNGALVIIDPIVAYLPDRTDMNSASAVRPILARLAKVAEETGVAIAFVRHLAKAAQNKAIYRGLGSIDFTAACRSVLMVGFDPNEAEKRVVAHGKSNLAAPGSSLAYTLKRGRFAWAGNSSLSAEDLGGPPPDADQRSAREEAREFLLQTLADGPRPQVEVQAEAAKIHISIASLRRAKGDLGVKAGDQIGEGTASETAVVGETPNLAARLQALAQSNQIVVSAATRAMLGDHFDLEDLGAAELKGFAEPVPAWRVLSARDVESRFAATRTGSSAPLVGRQEEMGLLLRAWDGSSHGRGQVVLIQGEAGVGKSRLVEGLREASGKDHIWVAIRCSPFHTASAFHPIIEHLKRVFGWEPEDTAPQHLAKLEAGLAGFRTLSLTESVPLFADLMAVPLPEDRYPRLSMTAQQERNATLDAIIAWLIETAERAPVLMAWEDLHWADPTTLETLGMLIEQAPTAAMLVVATYRPDLTPPWPQRSHMTPITLNRLERPEVETMVGHLAGGRSLPGEVVDHIVAKADGVPLYVEELTKAILGSGVLEARGDAYVLTGALAQLHIPETLQDSLMARLDRAPRLREVARAAGIAGTRGPA